MSRRFATLNRAAQEHGVTYPTIRNWIKNGNITAYRLPGVKGTCVDLNEVARHAGTMTARADYRSFGPDARVVDLSNVVGEEFEVER